jgi:hypothetical protein
MELRGVADHDEVSTPRCQVEPGRSCLASLAIHLAVPGTQKTGCQEWARPPRPAAAAPYLERGAELSGEVGRKAAGGPKQTPVIVVAVPRPSPPSAPQPNELSNRKPSRSGSA